MTKLISRLAACLLIVSVTACDFYDLDAIQPIDSVPANLAITDAQSAAAARAGLYDKLQAGTLTFDGYLAMPQYFSDEAIWTGTFPTRAEFDNYNVLPANATMAGVFTDYYDIINVANNILEILPTVEDASLEDPALVNSFLAEARFARAFAYFHLVQGWEDVPLILMPTRGVGEELNVPKSPAADVIAQAITDLEFARDNLTGASLGMTPAAASALLARIALIDGRWADAEAAALAAIGPDYDLTAIPYLEDEIFYIKFNSTDGNALAFFYGTAELNGRHSIEPSAKLIGSYEEGDLRKDISIGVDGSGVPYGNKYNDFFSATGAQTDPLLMIRGAEMVLILAETNARMGDFETASRYLNQVRTRAGLEDVTLTAENFEDLILQERFVELALEAGHRLWDLRRTDRAEDVLGPDGYDPCDDVWPLPQRDIDRNPNLQQNECCNC